jgi:hypothetical protein
VLLVLSATVVGAASEAGQEALVYGVRKRQLRKIFSTFDYWS